MAVNTGVQARSLNAEPQPLGPSLAAREALHPHRLCTIRAQAELGVFQKQDAHLWLPAAGQRHGCWSNHSDEHQPDDNGGAAHAEDQKASQCAV
jgi:hypothetical protein